MVLCYLVLTWQHTVQATRLGESLDEMIICAEHARTKSLPRPAARLLGAVSYTHLTLPTTERV